jgi:dynein heavy chain
MNSVLISEWLTMPFEMWRRISKCNVYVDGKKLKNTLKPKLEEVLENMKQVLLLTARETCQSLIESFHGRVDRLGERPSQLHNFADFVDSFNHIGRESIQMRSSAEEAEKMFELLHLSDVKIPTEDQVRVDDLQAVVKEYLEASEMAQAHKDSSMQSMAVSLERSISQINDDLLSMMTQLRSGDFVTVDADPKVVLEKLSVVKETINNLEEKANQFTSYEELFGLGQSTWDNLNDVTKQYEERLDLWQCLHDFQETTGKWREVPFNTMDVEDGNKTLQIHLKKSFGLHKKFHDPISDLYSQSVQEWKEFMPIILDLGNPAMRPRHWKRVFHLLNRPYQEDVALDSLISYGAMDEGDAISDISAVASGEYSLELTLNKIKEGWDECIFILKSHREQKDVFIIAQIDEVMQQLEDDMVTLQTMLASRFVLGIKEEVEKWEGYLRLLQEVLDEWLTCQRNWMYLEFIFSSEDIQRQLPTESMKFRAVDKEWKEFMRKANANPNVLDLGTKEGVLDMFLHANKTLEDVQKRLEDYLETKRAAFPRFYFLSNDELLEILSQTREPRAVQPHLGKCFDNIKQLEFKDAESDEITAMKSGEGEIATFSSPLFAEGNVEHWLLKVEESMRTSLYTIMKDCLHSYPESVREEWFFEYPAQCVLAVDQIMWTAEVTDALNKVESGDDMNALKDYFNGYLNQIQNMVEIVRGKLTRLQRMTMGALIVLDVHCRDVMDRMVQANCDSTNAFEWTMQLRYYWEEAINNCIVKQANADFSYGYEYMGNQARLVITPLTDRCYLTCTGALHLRLGGAPQGPAGTGKTESVKDLAKALARQCVVFNCSDGLDYKMMGRMFSGLSQCGAWSCFDEFNRIDIEVLSVIAQQMLTIVQALLRDADVFLFEGREIPLSPHFGVFITMNPGYAGRTELPDNLKALFRPVAMMIPDYALIGEIMLFSEGFSSAKSLAQKMVQLFKLSSEQLSKQDHYDFGMRAVKSILVMAGALKRAEPDLAEDIVLIRAMRDSNVPKFLEDDVKLFMAMIQDLFPGVNIPDIDYGVLQRQIEMELEEESLIPIPSFVCLEWYHRY